MIEPVSPRVPEVGVIGLVADRWGPLWQPRHHVLTRLSRHFHVVWVEPAHEWRQTPKRLRQRLPPGPDPAQAPGFVIYRPEPWRPRLFRPAWLAGYSYRSMLERARRTLLRRGCQQIILYLWRPDFAPALDVLEHDFSCYHIDDEYSWSTVELPLDPLEANLISRVDQVFIHSPALLEKKGFINPRTLYVPNGVDFEAYASPQPEPADLAGIPRPRVGYTGFLKTQLDLELLLGLARRHPEWSFVFVGGVQHQEIVPDLDALARLPNVYLLGARPVHDLARYPQHFDVCVMPYVADGFTKHIFPMKLHEYLASGQPTVGTRIPSLSPFADVVTLVDRHEDWHRAIADALTPSATTAERRTARQAVAREHDWDRLTARIAQALIS